MRVQLIVRNVFNNDDLVRFNTAAGSTTNAAGVLVWDPVLSDPSCRSGPSVDCAGFGQIQSENDYQIPRSYAVALGLHW